VKASISDLETVAAHRSTATTILGATSVPVDAPSSLNLNGPSGLGAQQHSEMLFRQR
jgi:hypothetical protein